MNHDSRQSSIKRECLDETACSYDELFEKEIEKLSDRFDLSSQANNLLTLIKNAESKGQPRPIPTPKKKLLNRRSSLTLSEPFRTFVEEEIESKYRSLLHRDITFMPTLPVSTNHLLCTRLKGIDSQYREQAISISYVTISQYDRNEYLPRNCLQQLNQCILMNTEPLNRPVLLFNRAILLGHQGKWDSAMNELNEAIKLDAQEPRYYHLRRY
jgi:hypothetical protein